MKLSFEIQSEEVKARRISEAEKKRNLRALRNLGLLVLDQSVHTRRKEKHRAKRKQELKTT